MKRYGMTPKFTAQDLKDNISQMECGVRAQSRTFHKLTDDFQWTGETANHKVPVMHLSVFPLEIQNDLATCKHFFK